MAEHAVQTVLFPTLFSKPLCNGTLLTERNNSVGVPHDSRRRASARMPRRARRMLRGHCTTLSSGGWNTGRWWPLARTAKASSRASGCPSPARLPGVSTSGIAKAVARAERPSVH